MKDINGLELSDKALVELVKIGIGTSKGNFDFSALLPDDWKNLMCESKSQAVILLTFDAAKDYIDLMPNDVYEAWFKLSVRVLSNNRSLLNAQTELDNILKQNGIEYVILKGSASAYYYPDYSKRNSGDIDFLTSTRDFPKVKELLVNAGYEMEMEDHDLHTVFKRSNVTLELHKKPAGMPDGVQGKLAENFMESTLNGALIEETPAFARPSDAVHALVILFHTIYHMFAGGMGLRHLCDWACFVNKTHKDLFWDEELLPLFKKMGLYKFVMTLTGACIDNLGIEQPDWFVEGSKELSDEIFEKVITLGNFGRKDPNKLKHYSFASLNGKKLTFGQKILKMISSLNATNRIMYPILNKAPYLYPFITVWRIIKYLALSALGKKTTLKQRMKYTDERAEIFERFEIYR